MTVPKHNIISCSNVSLGGRGNSVKTSSIWGNIHSLVLHYHVTLYGDARLDDVSRSAARLYIIG